MQKSMGKAQIMWSFNDGPNTSCLTTCATRSDNGSPSCEEERTLTESEDPQEQVEVSRHATFIVRERREREALLVDVTWFMKPSPRSEAAEQTLRRIISCFNLLPDRN